MKKLFYTLMLAFGLSLTAAPVIEAATPPAATSSSAKKAHRKAIRHRRRVRRRLRRRIRRLRARLHRVRVAQRRPARR